MLNAILEYTTTGNVPSVFIEAENHHKDKIKPLKKHEQDDLPKRMEGSHLNCHSKVLEKTDASGERIKSLPPCPVPVLTTTEPLNESATT